VLSERCVPIELDGEHGDLSAFSAFDGLADRAQVAFLGEMDHFIAEKYDFRLLCIRYLASRGWKWFGEEWPEREHQRPFERGILANARQPTGALDAAQDRFHAALRRVAPDARWFSFDADARDAEYVELASAATTYEELRPAMALRERIMQAKVGQVLEAHPGEKVALLAAAQHLLKSDDLVRQAGVGAGPGGDTEPSIGHHVTQVLGGGRPVLSFWFLHGEGTSASPWLPPPGRLRPVPGTVDAELLAACGGRPCLVPVGVGDDGGDDRDDDVVRSVTGMHGSVLECRLGEQVDGLVFAPSVTPLPS
jgi:hypothetical protein